MDQDSDDGIGKRDMKLAGFPKKKKNPYLDRK